MDKTGKYGLDKEEGSTRWIEEGVYEAFGPIAFNKNRDKLKEENPKQEEKHLAR